MCVQQIRQLLLEKRLWFFINRSSFLSLTTLWWVTVFAVPVALSNAFPAKYLVSTISSPSEKPMCRSLPSHQAEWPQSAQRGISCLLILLSIFQAASCLDSSEKCSVKVAGIFPPSLRVSKSPLEARHSLSHSWLREAADSVARSQTQMDGGNMGPLGLLLTWVGMSGVWPETLVLRGVWMMPPLMLILGPHFE